ncbi:MAG: ABC-type sugar transport system substrate-binding protein [Flavobacteriales bacterium]|jgi:ABC-type sugar transport system substrate-binding protein
MLLRHNNLLFAFMLRVFGVVAALCLAINTENVTANSVNSATKVPRVVLIAPERLGFWSNAIAFSQDVAKDLRLDLDIIYADSRFEALRAMKAVVARTEKPAYVIFHYQEGAGPEMLELAHKAEVSSFIINSEVASSERERVGTPRQHYPTWLGHMYPDDEQVGEQLASSLIRLAKAHLKKVDQVASRKLGKPQEANLQVNVLGVGGSSSSTAAILRNQGLQALVASDDGVKLRRLIATHWEGSTKAIRTLLRQYGGISVIWAASDTLALEGVHAAKEIGLRPGQDIFIGGIDWSLRGIQAVKSGDLSLSIGGHYMEAGWALILLYDHFHGYDFKPDLGRIIHLPMDEINQSNVDEYFTVFDMGAWKNINFQKFSKTYVSNIEHYDFSLEKIFDEFEALKVVSSSKQ